MSHLGRSFSALSCLTLFLGACTDAGDLEVQQLEVDADQSLADEPLADDAVQLAVPTAATPSRELPRPGVLPDLAAALAGGDPEEPLEIDVRVIVPPLQPAALAPLVATLDVRDGTPRYTLDGRAVDEATMAARAAGDRRRLDAALARQFADRGRLVDEAIAAAGVAADVRERGNTWFRVELPRARAQRLVQALQGRIDWARLAVRDAATTDLRNNLHDADHDGNPLDDGEDGAIEHIGILDYAHAYDMRGQGVGIWHNEGYAPYPNRPEFSDAQIEYLTTAHWQPVKTGGVCRFNDECCSGVCSGIIGAKTCAGSSCGNCTVEDGVCIGDVRGQEHATLVALIAHETAPEATIYHTATTFGDCMINGDVDLQTSPPVYVGAQSWSYEGGGGSDDSYNVIGSCNMEWDQYIAASRIAHFHSSGNFNAKYVGSPARSYNVIAVGNYNHQTSSMTVESGWLNPSTQVEKPELVAPGTGVTAATGWTRSGSSISSPMAAGFAADLMSGSAFFRNQPQAIKAYMIAGAHNAHSGAGLSGSNGAHDGAGRIDYLDTYFYRWGKVWNGDNDDFFNTQDKIVETHTLQAGQRYTIAIAWLAQGVYAYTGTALGTETLSQKLKLTVSRSGVGTWSAYVDNNNFQLIDFTVPASGGGVYTITIERMFNSGAGGVNLALTVGEHS